MTHIAHWPDQSGNGNHYTPGPNGGAHVTRKITAGPSALTRELRTAALGSTVDVKTEDLPPVCRLLAESVDSLSRHDVRAEAHRQWPNRYGSPWWFGWFPELDHQAREAIRGMAVGVALGVTFLEAPPLTVSLAVASEVDAKARELQEVERKAKGERDRVLRQRVEANRARAKRQRAARRDGR